MTINKKYQRFLKYFIIGFSTFLFDLILLYVFTDFFKINYLISVSLAFLIAVSINYYFSRRFVFSKTKRDLKLGFYIFLGITISGLIFITLLMLLLVEKLNLNYLVARIIVAGIVGIYNYTTNLFFNFKVVGEH